MSYQAFYRKFRPDTFGDVKGQGHIVTTLKNQIRAGRVGHAYLFCGTRGTGKTSVAKVFAKAVNCENPTEDGPCNECDMCKAIALGTSMNVIEIDAASNNRVDDIRQVIEEVQYSPPQGKYKVYIVDEVHMLSTSAFNALLKTLEEPPSYLIFILATTEVHKIPTTILSRCQRYDFRRISVETITDLLKSLLDKEGIEAEVKALQYIAKMADGAVRDGLSLLEQCVSLYYGEKLTYEKVLQILGTVDYEVYDKFTRFLTASNVHQVIVLLNQVILEGKDLSQFCIEYVWYLRNLLLIKSSEEAMEVKKSTSLDMIDVSSENMQELKEIAGLLEMEIILRYIRVMSELCNQLRYATSKRVLLEVAMIKLCKPQMESDYESLVNRIANLEKNRANVVVQSPQGTDDIVRSNQLPGQMGQLEETASVNNELKSKFMEKAISEELEQVAKNWESILRAFEPSDQAMMSGVKLIVGENNHLIFAFLDDTSTSYFNDMEKKESIEKIISNKIGKEVKIDVKSSGNKTEHEQMPELRDMFHINEKVKIEYLD